MKNNFRVLLLLSLIYFYFPLSVTGQGLPVAKPEEEGLSSERLERIKPVMQRYIDQNKLSGLITVIARHGKVVHFEKYGQMDTNKPMQFDAIFRIASMTKPITSVAIMMLYEEGYFQLTDPLSKFIPDFENVKVFSGVDENGIKLVNQENPITIQNLLTHTSGLTYGEKNTPVDSMYNKASLFEGTLEEMIKKLVKLPLLYQPGTKFNYSVSTDVLGYLVEVISGKPFNEFLEEKIFRPLNMKDTDFYVPENKINRFASLYAREENGGIKIIDKPKTSVKSKPTKFFGGGGGLVSTASDYMRFAQMLLNKGELDGKRLLGPKTVEFMTRNHISEELFPIHSTMGGVGWGLGFAVVLNAPKYGLLGSDGEYYWGGANNTFFWIDPKEDIILLLMTQFSPYSYYPINREFKVLVYQAIVD